ncbi:MAG: lipoyl synthase [Myxococcota bacterium]
MTELLPIVEVREGAKVGRRSLRDPNRPPWIRVRLRSSPRLERVRALVGDLRLHTVCESAACPNLAECWSEGTATLMIAGNRCTRRCGFCDVETARPAPLDPDEPERVAEAIAALGLRFAVITSVARDDLRDGGAAHFRETVEAVHRRAPDCRVEVLIPDFKGEREALRCVLEAGPDVLNHNLETVERLQRKVRPAARYERSLDLLGRAARLRPEIPTKTGLMLGLGETEAEVRQTLRDIRERECRLLTLGQYLRPSAAHLPVARYLTPDEFRRWEDEARGLGFRDVAAGPLVRSSYHADRLAREPAPHASRSTRSR